MYNLEVYQVHNYSVSEVGVLVHNVYDGGIINRIDKIEQLDRSLLNKPSTKGSPATFKSDGTSVEIHHINQNPAGPSIEMHWIDHRGKGNHKINHPNRESKIDRRYFDNAKREYWKKVYDDWEDF